MEDVAKGKLTGAANLVPEIPVVLAKQGGDFGKVLHFAEAAERLQEL
ncbi:MAG: hypothetical protein WDO16_17290 [Bacteroidota bacterium]